MGRRLCLALLVGMLAVAGARDIKVKHADYSHVYNQTLATILVEYASAVYMSDLTELFTWTCSRCCDKIKEFEILEIVVDVQNCLQAFVGVDVNLNSIIIAFRGTQENSLQNWIEDLFWKQLDLNYPGMPDAMVHHGFYYAYQNTTIRPGILDAVQQAKEIYGDIGIMVTGHSMGGAMASFCAFDLVVNHKMHDVQLMTFGQPRVGNGAFASYFAKQVPRTIRLVNRHDMVPHLPPYYSFLPQKTYHHFPREVWLYDIGFGSLVYEVIKICDKSGEDPTCCSSVSGNSLTDHLSYLGADLHTDGWGSCKIVMNKQMKNLRSDSVGNFVIAKDETALSILKLKNQPYTDKVST